MNDWHESDHPRRADGRFRDKAGGWVDAVSAAIRSPEQDLLDLVTRTETTRTDELSGGRSALTRIYTRRAPDGTEHRLVGKTYSFMWGADAVAAEVLATHIGRALGARVPVSILDPDDPGNSLFMELLPGESAYDHIVREHDGIYDALVPFVRTSSGRRLGLLDLLLHNRDRSAANWMVLPDGSVAGIDHSHVHLNDEGAGEREYWPWSTFTNNYLVDEDFGPELDRIEDLGSAEVAAIRERLVALFARPDLQPLIAASRADTAYLLRRWDEIAAMAQEAD